MKRHFQYELPFGTMTCPCRNILVDDEGSITAILDWECLDSTALAMFTATAFLIDADRMKNRFEMSMQTRMKMRRRKRPRKALTMKAKLGSIGFISCSTSRHSCVRST